MGIRDISLTTIDGQQTTLADYADKTVLVVNVASRCGLTPQYEKLEQLQKQYEDQGFTVLGFPCNQFMGQEPGSNEQIADFCSTTYGVTFPLMDKVKVNGKNRHPLYAELTKTVADDGKAGKVKWNFEKYVIAPDGTVGVFYEGFGRPQGIAFDANGTLFVIDALAGSSGLYRFSREGAPELVLAGPGLVGVAFDPLGGYVVCTNDTAYRLSPGLGTLKSEV